MRASKGRIIVVTTLQVQRTSKTKPFFLLAFNPVGTFYPAPLISLSFVMVPLTSFLIIRPYQ